MGKEVGNEVGDPWCSSRVRESDGNASLSLFSLAQGMRAGRQRIYFKLLMREVDMVLDPHGKLPIGCQFFAERDRETRGWCAASAMQM